MVKPSPLLTVCRTVKRTLPVKDSGFQDAIWVEGLRLRRSGIWDLNVSPLASV